MQTIYSKQSKYGLIEVVQNGDIRSLLFDKCCQGRLNLRTEKPESLYVKQILGLIDRLHYRRSEVLVLGGGAFLLPTFLAMKGHTIWVVERDEEIVNVARDYFFAKWDNLAVCDAEEVKGQYDIVIHDLFDGYEFSGPSSEETFNKHVEPGGILLENQLYDVTFRIKE